MGICTSSESILLLLMVMGSAQTFIHLRMHDACSLRQPHWCSTEVNEHFDSGPKGPDATLFGLHSNADVVGDDVEGGGGALIHDLLGQQNGAAVLSAQDAPVESQSVEEKLLLP